MKFEDIFNQKERVKFTRKKKCDVCHKVKLVSHECEKCYNDGFDKMANNLFEMGVKDAREILLRELKGEFEEGSNIFFRVKMVFRKTESAEKSRGTKK